MNTKPTSIVIHCLVAGALLGGILDTGLGSILPCAPWPTPLGTGFGTLIGSAAGGLGYALILAGMKIGNYTDLKNKTIHRLIYKASLFIIACSIMGGVIGFISAKRDIADRPMAQLREAYRDIGDRRRRRPWGRRCSGRDGTARRFPLLLRQSRSRRYARWRGRDAARRRRRR